MLVRCVDTITVEPKRKPQVSEILDQCKYDTNLFQQLVRKLLIPAIVVTFDRATQSRDQKLLNLGIGWTYFALACLTAYIPDRAFDPAIKLRVVREIYDRRVRALES